MKNNKIKWIISALEDLRSIKAYIGKTSPKYAKLQGERIVQKVRILKENLRAGSPLEDVEDKEVRYLVTGSYKIIYLVVSDEEVHIIRVWHTARDFNVDSDI